MAEFHFRESRKGSSAIVNQST
ncbi:uncharacterized protein G2W53_010134 [Senna tora]|uniref:Uncharacterized protein n=1 Tax=Senna tora TaxID=362788 RepID=A0A835CB21_9FABA|nr:uncharacterized protein G2W53_010134 [Senna tora]